MIDIRAGKESAMDWKAIKLEYITTDTSYSKLSAKHKVSRSAIAKKAGQEGWVEEKERHYNDSVTKTVAIFEKKQSERATKIINIANKLLSKVEESVEMLDPNDRQGFRQLTAALKDIKEIQMVKSEADIREQEARIKNLQKQAEADDNGSTEVVVTFGTDEEQGKWAE